MASCATRGGPSQRRTGGVWLRFGAIGQRSFTVIPAFLSLQKTLQNPIRNGRNRIQNRLKSIKTQRETSGVTKNTVGRTKPAVEYAKLRVSKISFFPSFFSYFLRFLVSRFWMFFNLF